MPIHELTKDGLVPVPETTFAAEGLKERADLQRLLKQRIESLEDGLMVLTDEFDGWVDSLRRIDLLCLDADANLVVVELKRDEEGGHMELQAIRYAAMVSAMTFDQAVATLAKHRNKTNPDLDAAQAEILAFLEWKTPDEDSFGAETRIILVSADFGKELTTAVLWLRDHGMDIRCIRLKPYKLADGRVFVDVQQLIPLPEAEEFQTKLGDKRSAERKENAERSDQRYRFWEGLLSAAKERTNLHAGRNPSTASFTSGSAGRAGFEFTYAIRKFDSQVELWIMKSKPAFQQLLAQKAAIEHDFGESLEWQELPGKEGSRIRFVVAGGYRSPPAEWPKTHATLVDAMIRLDKALRARVAKLP